MNFYKVENARDHCLSARNCLYINKALNLVWTLKSEACVFGVPNSSFFFGQISLTKEALLKLGRNTQLKLQSSELMCLEKGVEYSRIGITPVWMPQAFSLQCSSPGFVVLFTRRDAYLTIIREEHCPGGGRGRPTSSQGRGGGKARVRLD